MARLRYYGIRKFTDFANLHLDHLYNKTLIPYLAHLEPAMPLYKITERRLKRKERDEEDPIAYLKAALRGEMGAGGSETDDDESDSDSDSDEDENEDDEDEESGSEDEEEGNEVAGPSGMSTHHCTVITPS